jgi:hypothetical protein
MPASGRVGLEPGQQVLHLGDDPVLGEPSGVDPEKVMAAEADSGAGGCGGALHAPLVAAVSDPASGHEIAFRDLADLDSERHVQEDVTAHADDLGQLLRSVDQAGRPGQDPMKSGVTIWSVIARLPFHSSSSHRR